MNTATDITLDATGDLPIETNDLSIQPSDSQHIEDCIASFPGWWKQFPLNGVGIKAYLNSSGQFQKASKYIRLQLQNDGYTVGPNIVTASGSTLVVNASQAART
jgi:hypothetical protein